MAPVQVTTAPETEHETEEETEETVEEPEERIAVDGKIKSYLTGEMVDGGEGRPRTGGCDDE